MFIYNGVLVSACGDRNLVRANGCMYNACDDFYDVFNRRYSETSIKVRRIWSDEVWKEMVEGEMD